MLWVPDGPNGRWLSFDTKTEKFLAFAWPKGKGNAGGNSMALHPDGTIWATGGNKEARMLRPEDREFKFYQSPERQGRQASLPAPTASRSPATARCGGPRTRSTRWRGSIPKTGKIERVQDPVRRATPSRAA